MVVKQLKQFKMQILSFSEKGNRPENEDFVLSATLNESTSIHIVADGMGGFEHGALAANTVANTIVDYLKEHLKEESNIETIIQDAIRISNIAIQNQRSSYKSKMGSTIAGILLNNEKAYCFWVGDVRIYHFQNKVIKFQSKDHSLINELVNNGQIITPSLNDQYRHIVTKAIQGNIEDIKPDIVVLKDITEIDTFIICSDGVHNVFGSSELEYMFQSSNNDEHLLNQIKEKCQKESGDNYSMIMITLRKAF
jgi:serine/threonine protein phosphatase PrpC